jgi:dihydroflavonol-4-reductase
LNVVPVRDVAAGHLAAAERGVPGERYILGGRNMSLKEIFEALAAVTGRAAPRVKLPHAVALTIGYGSELAARVLRQEPAVPVDAVRMARHSMFVSSSKAAAALGFNAGPIEAALDEAVRWYVEHRYAPDPRRHPRAPQESLSLRVVRVLRGSGPR